MKKYAEIFRKCELFRGIEEEKLMAMLGCLGVQVRTVSKNQIIFQEGDPAKYVGLVLTGEGQVVLEDYYGNRSIVTNIEPTQMFAEAFSCAGVEMLPISVAAVCDSDVMLIDCKRILTVCSNVKASYGIMESEAEMQVRNNMLSNWKLFQYAQENGYEITSEAFNDAVDRKIRIYETASDFGTVCDALDTVGLAFRQYFSLQEDSYYMQETIDNLYRVKYDEYRHGTNVMNGVPCSDVTEYWNCFVQMVSEQEEDEEKLAEFNEKLEDAAEFYYNYKR